jgi:hypothetical protein
VFDESLPFLLSESAARFVVIADDDDVGAAETLIEFRAPPVYAFGIRRGRKAELDRAVAILLALTIQNDLPRLNRGLEFRPPVKHARRFS